MPGERAVEALPALIPRAFALRMLGQRKGGRPLRASAMELFEQEQAAALELVAARAVLRASAGGLPGSRHVDPDLPLVAAVCTIGPALEQRVTELAARGETARALVLDAIGSAAAEGAAESSNALACRMAVPAGLAPRRRRSPGYGRWDVREQRALFAFVAPGEIGVELTESCMMTPRKSVSFIVPLEAGAAGSSPARRCARCGLEDCPYREDDVDGGAP